MSRAAPVTRDQVISALRKAKGRRAQAAEALDLSTAGLLAAVHRLKLRKELAQLARDEKWPSRTAQATAAAAALRRDRRDAA